MSDFITVRNALTGKSRQIRLPAREGKARAREPRTPRTVKVEPDLKQDEFVASMKATRAVLAAQAEDLGLTVPASATKAQILDLIETAGKEQGDGEDNG